MSLWTVPVFFAALATCASSRRVRVRVTRWFDDLSRARVVREHLAVERERMLAVDSAGLGERVLDESISECAYDHSGRGESTWTYGEVGEVALAIERLTYFVPAEWAS